MLDILLFLFNSYETENGIKIVSIGKLKDKKTFVVSGSYAYTGSTNDMNPPLMVCGRLMNDYFFYSIWYQVPMENGIEFVILVSAIIWLC